MARSYGLERSRQITAEAPEPLIKPDSQPGDVRRKKMPNRKCRHTEQDDVIATVPSGIPETQEKPRRYEVRDAETGEKLSGVSFILTPTGEEMHLLTASGKQVGPMQDIGIYYHGELNEGVTGADSLPMLTPIALEYMVLNIFDQLATRLHPRAQQRGIGALKHLGNKALEMYEKHSQGSDRG